MSIEQNILSLLRRFGIASEFCIDNRILSIVRIQHLRVGAMLFE